MDKEAFLDSGIIENYVLGIATEQEETLLVKMAETHKEVKAQWVLLETAFENYLSSFSSAPQEHAKNTILQKIFPTKVMALHNPFVNRWWIAAALVVVSLGILYVANLHMQIKQANAQIVQLQGTQKKLTYENLINKANYRNASEQLSILHKHGNRTTYLQGTEVFKEASAIVYWNASTKEVFLHIDNLPKPAKGMQYQLWAIADGKPVDAGIIEITTLENIIYPMKTIENAQAFAISLETEGGAKVPNTQAIYAMGNI